jgi:hypothetical protein
MEGQGEMQGQAGAEVREGRPPLLAQPRELLVEEPLGELAGLDEEARDPRMEGRHRQAGAQPCHLLRRPLPPLAVAIDQHRRTALQESGLCYSPPA